MFETGQANVILADVRLIWVLSKHLLENVPSRLSRSDKGFVPSVFMLQEFSVPIPWHACSELRDTLLPKLISGEVRIPDAEKLAEAALA